MTGARAAAGTVAFSEADTITKTATGRSVLCAVNLSIYATVAQNSFFNIREVLIPNHFAGDESDLTILPILADLEAEHPEFENVVKLLQTDSILVIKGFAGK